MRLGSLGTAALAALALPLLGGGALAAAGPKGHKHTTFNAGVPGDPRKSFRTVEIKATEGSGTMAFDPPRIEVARGEQIKFVIRNAGELPHEFMLDTVAANQKHAIEMQKNPEMEHDDPNGKRVEPKKDVELIWRFTKVGTFEYACLIPGHYEAGMKGIVEVVAKGKAKAAAKSPTPPIAAKAP
jgi:uncharacterized cupredoxin-like copper-binding protein